MRVIIRQAAFDDLERIHSWILKDRPRSADAVIERILESAERLGEYEWAKIWSPLRQFSMGLSPDLKSEHRTTRMDRMAFCD
jgi:hypothetical protein